MDDMLLRIVGCLLQVLQDHGAAAYHRAGRRALTAICTVLIEEVEASQTTQRPSGKVVRFPLVTRGQYDPDD